MIPFESSKDFKLFQSFFEFGVAVGDGLFPDRDVEGLGRADEDAYLLGTGYARVDEIALEHDVVAHAHRHDYHRELRALALVNGDGIGERQFIELRHVVFNRVAVEDHGQCSVGGIDSGDIADVAVEYVLVVIVANLHHLVALAIDVPGTTQTWAVGIESGLKYGIEIGRANFSALHGCEHLYLARLVTVSLG